MPTTEKPESKLETKNNIPNPQSIHRGKHYSNLDWKTWRKKEPPVTRTSNRGAVLELWKIA